MGAEVGQQGMVVLMVEKAEKVEGKAEETEGGRVRRRVDASDV